MVLATSFFFYFFSLAMFSLVSHPVYYCILLVLNSLICSFICYSVYGFSWYSLLFCLVYIGGVYILFVFVSVHSPNSSVVSYWNFSYLGSFLIVFLCVAMGFLVCYMVANSEFSSFLCTLSEGYFYLCMCLTLLFGFFILSLIMSIKVNHYR
uniref:NADH dehydrogenase subunit 6 n=1 Tax=Scalithrium magniphallum TaxID=2810039 RepID=A0A8K1SXY4_9CEST|nr:NADH dehydrogenase subunit 6 [Scalithrium magniphalum]